MPSPLVECVPNFSEGRRREVIQAILDVFASQADIQILDHHSDADHNRSVVTLVGQPDAMENALFLAIQKAAALIDMDHHQGEHPRIGATDVVPFIPIRDFTMQECVEMARRLGKRVGGELNIPVYLYEAAAASPDRHNLEDIRRGQYEGLKVEIGSNPDRSPDFGPAQLGSAGATVIGAREPLIAFNIYLDSQNVEIARKIAKAIRFSGGGLRYLKAMGVLVDGLAQVSMNLTDFHRTPIAQVVEMVRREALRFGVNIHHSELVGLVPQQALLDAAVWYTQLDEFEYHQVLENKLSSAVQPVESGSSGNSADFLDQLASASPVPGGGSASAFTAAEAAALVAMVARLTIGKKKYANVEKEMWQLVEQAEVLRKQLTRLVTEDAAVFEKVITAARLTKDTPEQEVARQQAMQSASLEAARVPLQTARLALQVSQYSIKAAALGNNNAISDAATASALAHAAIVGAGGNVRINLVGLPDGPDIQAILSELMDMEAKAAKADQEIRQVIQERANLKIW